MTTRLEALAKKIEGLDGAKELLEAHVLARKIIDEMSRYTSISSMFEADCAVFTGVAEALDGPQLTSLNVVPFSSKLAAGSFLAQSPDHAVHLWFGHMLREGRLRPGVVHARVTWEGRSKTYKLELKSSAEEGAS